MGELPRGGFYSYDWIERLMGMKVSSAAPLLPQHQTLQVGQALDRTGNMLVKAVEPEHFGWTRLVSRVRARLTRPARGIRLLLLRDPGQFLMERRMLLGIKQRAERSHSR